MNGEYFLTLEGGHELKLSRTYRDKVEYFLKGARPESRWLWAVTPTSERACRKRCLVAIDDANAFRPDRFAL